MRKTFSHCSEAAPDYFACCGYNRKCAGIDFRNFAFQPYSLNSAANRVNHIFFIAAELSDCNICRYSVMKRFHYKIGNLFILFRHNNKIFATVNAFYDAVNQKRFSKQTEH